jgi:hypothetical protein
MSLGVVLAIGWILGAVAGFASQRPLRDASRGVRLGVPMLVLASGIAGGSFLAQPIVGAGFGFAIGFLWADARWKAESVTRRDGLR